MTALGIIPWYLYYYSKEELAVFETKAALSVRLYFSKKGITWAKFWEYGIFKMKLRNVILESIA